MKNKFFEIKHLILFISVTVYFIIIVIFYFIYLFIGKKVVYSNFKVLLIQDIYI